MCIYALCTHFCFAICMTCHVNTMLRFVAQKATNTPIEMHTCIYLFYKLNAHVHYITFILHESQETLLHHNGCIATSAQFRIGFLHENSRTTYHNIVGNTSRTKCNELYALLLLRNLPKV